MIIIKNWLKAAKGFVDGAKLEIGNSSRSEAGFTLIEVLVASAILVILAVGLLGIQYIIGQNQVSVWRNYLSIESANISMSAMTKEIRDARQSESGSYPLEIADDQEIVFYTDYDYDGIVERIRYTLSGTDLVKGIIEPQGEPLSYSTDNELSKVISDIVRNAATPVFYYYNSEWPADTVNNPLILSDRISETRQVKIYLETNPYINSSNDYVLESDVRIRMINY